MTWAALFADAAAHDVSLEEIQDALAERREGV